MSARENITVVGEAHRRGGEGRRPCRGRAAAVRGAKRMRNNRDQVVVVVSDD